MHVKIYLTPKGKNKRDRLFELRDKNVDEIAKLSSPDECTELIASLTKIQQALLKYK